MTDLTTRIEKFLAEGQALLDEVRAGKEKTPEQESREMLNLAGHQYDLDHVDMLAKLITENRQLRKLCGLMKESDVKLTYNRSKGWVEFTCNHEVFLENGDILHCYKVTK